MRAVERSAGARTGRDTTFAMRSRMSAARVGGAGWLDRRSVLAGILSAFGVTRSQAQPLSCVVEEGSSSMLRALRCQETLLVVAEASVQLAAIEERGRLVGFRVAGGAAYIDPGGARTEPFRIETPLGIVETRGGAFALVADRGRTSVFARSGEVLVRRGDEQVTLQAGQGIDLEAGRRLAVVAWSRPRAARLLARLGQR